MELEAKKWYTSKTVWVNVLMAIGIVLNTTVWGDLLNAETQGAIVIVVNLIFRLITGKPLKR